MNKWIEILYPKNLMDSKGRNINKQFIDLVYQNYLDDKSEHNARPDAASPFSIALCINHQTNVFTPLGWAIDLQTRSDNTLWALIEDDSKIVEMQKEGWTRPGRYSGGFEPVDIFNPAKGMRLAHISIEAGKDLPAMAGLREQVFISLSLDRKKIIEKLEAKKMPNLDKVKFYMKELFNLDMEITLGAACPPAVSELAEKMIEKGTDEDVAYATAWKKYNEGELSANLDTTKNNTQEKNMTELELSNKVTELTDSYKKEIEKLNLGMNGLSEKLNLELKAKDELIAAGDARIKELEQKDKRLNLSKQIESLGCIPPAKMEEAIQYGLANDSEKFLELLKGLPKLNLDKNIIPAINPVNDEAKIKEEKSKGLDNLIKNYSGTEVK